MLSNGTKVWVRILAGPNSPEALVPGIVTDARIADREVVRSQAKGGRLVLPNTVVVISFRHPPSRDPFYVERPEQVIGIAPRSEHLAVIDGPEDADLWNEVVPALRREVAVGLDRIAPQPADAAMKEAAKQYAGAPALAIS